MRAYRSTSPSIYLQFMGTAVVTDECTTVGPKLTNPILTLPPGVLTTWRPLPFGVDGDYLESWFIGDVWSHDDTWDEPVPGFGYTAPLDVNDLACPTWGLGLSTATNGTIFTTVGPPWLPLIRPPTEMFSLNPTWAAICTAINYNFAEIIALDFLDPPYALTVAPSLLPTSLSRSASKPAPAPANPTSVPEQVNPSTEAAKPASLPSDPAAPAQTGNSGKNTPAQSPDIASPDPARSANLPGNPVASSMNEGDPPTDPSSDPRVPVVPLPQPVEDPQTQAQGLGAIIYNAVGRSATPILAVAGQTFTPNPSAFSIAGTVVSAGGPAVTVGGTAINLDPSGVLAVGGSTISLTTPSSTPLAEEAFTVAGQTFTPNPSAFSIAGTIVSAGGPAVTVGGTAIDLDPSKVLAVSSSTISLKPLSSAPLAEEVFTMAGQTFTPNPSAFSIAGTTISADGPAVTTGGIIISLGQHGALKIGSSTINLPTPSNIFPSKLYTVAGQVFTPNPSAFSIAGTNISAGGPAATVGGTVISLEPSGTLVIGSSTIPLLPKTALLSDVDIGGFDVIAHSSFAVVDGVTLSAATAGVTVSGNVVSLEAGDATLDIGTGRFILPTPVTGTNGSLNVQAFVGGQSKGLYVSVHLVWGVYGALMLLMWH